MEITSARNAKTLSPSHMKHCIFSESRFDFLKDLVKSLPDMAGEGDECFNSTPSARTTKLSSEVPSVEKEKEYSVEGRVPQGVKDPPNPCLRVGECYKTYGNISRSNVKNSPNYDSDSSDQLPLSNHLETMASGDNSLPQPPVTNYYSVAKHGDASVVPPNNFKERGLSVANPVDNSDVLPVKQTTLTFGENVQPTTSSVTLDEDYDA